MPLSDAECVATYKILVLGDASVGKTALLRCLMGQEFREKLHPTIDLCLESVATYKILVLGDASLGKTALLRRLVGQEFREKLLPTTATDFVRRKVEVDGALVELHIWDSAGQERFRSVTRWQYRGVKGVVMVYDVTDRATFTHLSYWLESVNQEISYTHNKYESVPVVLLGNKVDLEELRQVRRKEGAKLAEKEMTIEFYETSAKTGQNVFDAFRKLAYHVTDICNPDVMKSYHKNMIRQPDPYVLDTNEVVATGPKLKMGASKTEAEWTKSLPLFSSKSIKLKKRKRKRTRRCCVLS